MCLRYVFGVIQQKYGLRILWFVLCQWVFSVLLIAQAKSMDDRICLNLKNANPINVLHELRKLTGLNVAYESSLLNTQTRFTYASCDKTIKQVLVDLFPNSSSDFALVSNQIIVLKRKPLLAKGPTQVQVTKARVSQVERVVQKTNEQALTRLNPILFENIEKVQISKVLFSDYGNEFAVAVDTLLQMQSGEENLIVFSAANSSYESVLRNRSFTIKDVSVWGVLSSNDDIQLHNRNDIQMATRKRLAKSSNVPHKQQNWNSSYNSFLPLDQYNSLQFSMDMGYLLPVNTSTVLGANTFNYSATNPCVKFSIKYATEHVFVKVGFGIKNLSATIIDNRMSLINDTISSTTKLVERQEKVDDYFVLSAAGDTSWYSGYKTISELQTEYEIRRYSAQLKQMNSYSTQYFHVPVALGYVFNVSSKFSVGTYAQVGCNFLYKSFSDKKIVFENYLNESLFSQSFLSYSLGLNFDWHLTDWFSVYCFGQYEGANTLKAISIPNRQFDLTAFTVGFGVGYNLQWYSKLKD